MFKINTLLCMLTMPFICLMFAQNADAQNADAQNINLQSNHVSQTLESGILEVVPVVLPSMQMPKFQKVEPIAIHLDLHKKLKNTEISNQVIEGNQGIERPKSTQTQLKVTNPAHPNHPNRSNFYVGKVIDGKITYYKRGKRTANGEKFDFNGMTAAHAFLPFNTLVKVTNLRNQKSVTVRVNDRCSPKFKIIDLAMGAGKKIDMIRSGVIQAKIEIIKLGNGQTHYQRSKSSKSKSSKSKSSKSKK
jgi:rare lipoprotein A (peptidoglycan hydrolase)